MPTYGEQRHEVRRPPGEDVDSASPKLQGVDRVGGQKAGDARRQRDSKHQRQDDLVIAGQLEQDQNGCDRSTGRAGEDRAHAHQSIGPGRCDQTGCERVGDRAEGGSEHAADEQGRSEDTARATDADGQAGG
jgi:hypothetical protein